MSEAQWFGTAEHSVDSPAMNLMMALRADRWDAAFELLESHPELINQVLPGDPSGNAPLHHAALRGVSEATVTHLVSAGAWRTMRNAAGVTARDLAARGRYEHLLGALEPVLRHHIETDALDAMEGHLHRVIRARGGGFVDELIREQGVRLPQLAPLLELDTPRMWFGVPGMIGGFNCELQPVYDDFVLVVDSWSRVVGGSGERHIISPHGALLVASGFV